jgi:hypothetical protein
MSVSIKDVKKGTRVVLRNGWEAEVADNRVNGHTRFCTVYGPHTEMGSVYTTDIHSALMADGQWYVVEHSPSKLKTAKDRAGWGF